VKRADFYRTKSELQRNSCTLEYIYFFLLGQDLCEVVKANILLMNNSVCVTNEGDVTELNRTEQTRKHKFNLIKQ